MRDLPRGTQVADHGGHLAFVYGAVTLSGLPFLTGSHSEWLGNSADDRPAIDDRLLPPPLITGNRHTTCAVLVPAVFTVPSPVHITFFPRICNILSKYLHYSHPCGSRYG